MQLFKIRELFAPAEHGSQPETAPCAAPHANYKEREQWMRRPAEYWRWDSVR